ncbi:type I restriction enzyme HsdR N-terminal domain-containing protein [Segetibacter aerophilus]|uniref:Restriction endonuclease subunit R n=1 Tax=Segetibacter aerophilus TaxID=670293 RepID=A0A512BIN1_9BACT|nr:type I restriction enzyme HsdR N-terminal domain-containing protein [Segetibacter aerophilus]GEO11677.1 restriction endonuclease subunit R [Segetibacter aerophilus]
MIAITYPTHPFKIKKEQGKEIIFDECRKQWVLITPEEWVRQNFLQYLMQVKKYPCSLIAVEREIMLGDTKKRFDIVVFKNAVPWMIVECKEMNVELNEAVIKQILNYNIKLQVEYLVVTNGKSTFGLYIQQGKFEWLNELPDF